MTKRKHGEWMEAEWVRRERIARAERAVVRATLNAQKHGKYMTDEQFRAVARLLAARARKGKR